MSKTANWKEEFDEFLAKEKITYALGFCDKTSEKTLYKLFEFVESLLEKEREKAVKVMRSGKIAGSFSEGCSCDKCNLYEKKIITLLKK